MIEKLRNTTYRLLRQSERYTKTDMVYLTTGGFWLSLKTLFSLVIAFGLSVAFANLLPPTTYGEYKYVFTIFGFLSLFTFMGMGTSVARAVAQGFDGTAREALRTKIRFGLIGSIVSASGALYYFFQGNWELGGAFAIVALFLPFTDTLGLFNSILNGKKLFNVSTGFELLVQGVAATVIVTTLFFTDNLLIILGVYFIVYTGMRLLVFKIVMRRYAANNTSDPEAIAYGKHLSTMDFFNVISEALDNILLWQFIGPASLATYAFAKGIPVQISTAMQRVLSLAFPKFAERDFASIKESLLHKMLMIFFLMLSIVIAYILAAPYVFNLFFPQYIEAVGYSQLFALTLLFFPQKFIGTAFQAHARINALYITSTVVPLVRIAVSLALVPFFGIVGVIAAELTCRTVNFVLLIGLLVRSR